KLLSQRYGTRVGDEFEIAAFDQEQVERNAFDSDEAPAVPRFTAKLVGIIETPADFDDPSPTVLFSPAFFSTHPTVGLVQTLIGMGLDPGTDPQAILDAIHAMPNGADAYPIQSRIVSPDTRRAVRFQTTALWLVTGVTIAAAAFVVAQVAARTLNVADPERASLAAMGLRRRQLAAERAVEGALAVVVSLPVALVVGYALSALFPLGLL